MKREIKIYKRLPNGKFEKEVKEEKKAYRHEIERVSDGKIYKSITKCRLENKLCKYAIYKLLEEGTKFKRVN